MIRSWDEDTFNVHLKILNRIKGTPMSTYSLSPLVSRKSHLSVSAQCGFPSGTILGATPSAKTCSRSFGGRGSHQSLSTGDNIYIYSIFKMFTRLYQRRVSDELKAPDGQMDSRAGEKSIILSQREFRDGNRYHKKVTFEFEKEKESQEKEDKTLEACWATVQQFLTSSKHVEVWTIRVNEAHSIFNEMILNMKCLWDPPRYKDTKESRRRRIHRQMLEHSHDICQPQ